MQIFKNRIEEQSDPTDFLRLRKIQAEVPHSSVLDTIGPGLFVADSEAVLQQALADIREIAGSAGYNKTIDVVSITPVPKTQAGTITGTVNKNDLTTKEQAEGNANYNDRTIGTLLVVGEAPLQLNLNVTSVQYVIFYEVAAQESD